MSIESRQVSGEGLGSLQSCLVEGDPQQRIRERGERRRALAISIATQSVILAALVLIPLLGKPAHIAFANVVPVPPYYSHPGERRGTPEPPPDHVRRDVCRVCPTMPLAPTMPIHDTAEPQTVDVDPIPGSINGPSVSGQIPMSGGLPQPPPPRAEVERPQVLHFTHLDPALLTRRVEPVYPTLMRQIGRSGRVELRAMIATDGSMQSLQVVSGDPGFYQSALEAVRQWRYKPTILNGTPVEVDTFITVIYNIAR
jgi:periplasmic protein TonB